jgi:crotonobetainyl-CoA:carnitine CoA-transferase CaiB-like acyl-CoA transferase
MMQALDGVTVLDLTQHLSGPYCTMILGDAGADVVKVEKPQGGDDQRRLGPLVNGESAPFMMINRNKRSLTLNLKSPEGVELLLRLAAAADVLIENFRPGVVDTLGIGYARLSQVNPALVYCSISGYGQTGPDRDKGGFDILAQGMTGIMDLNTPQGTRPTKTPISLHDLGAGLTAAYSILSAYIHRLKTGEGQFIDVSLIESGLALTVQEAAAYFVNGSVPRVSGTRNHLSAPYQAYRSRDGYVVVGAGNQKLWEIFCTRVVDQPGWVDDPRYATATDRVVHADELEAQIESVLVERDTAHWVEMLDSAGVPGGPINTYAQALADPQVQARDMVLTIEHPTAGAVSALGFPAKMSATPGQVRYAAPTLGQHTDAVLREKLRLTDAEVQELRARNVI